VLYEDYRYTSGYVGGSGESYLRKMAEETGGISFRVGRRESLDDIYDQIQRAMRSQYALGYTSTNTARDGAFRKLEIRLKDKNQKVLARKGYYATRG
jgi:VWFA-related protein